MNIAQILRMALFDADAVNSDGTTHRFVTEPELLVWAQEGHDYALAKLRQAQQDYGLTIRASTDADLRYQGVTYDCSSFGLTTSARTYTLPPDLVSLRRIRALTTGEEYRTFEHKDMADPVFVELSRVESSATEAGRLYWDVIGERTLIFPQPPDVALDIEISYIALPPMLRLYSTGTVSTTQNSTAVTGASTPNWVIQELTTPMELMTATGAVAPKIVTQTSTDPTVDPSALYSPVASIDTNTTMTLMGAWLPTAISTKAYLLASVPSLPRAWHWVLVRWVSMMIRWKASGSVPSERPDFEAISNTAMIPDVSQRQTADAETVEDFDPGDSEWE